MSGQREQRTVFGEVAELYDEVRPGYPESLIDDLLAFAAGTQRALEVGAGTGKATVALAARGISILALEPSPAMATAARGACRAYPAVSVVVSTFERWQKPAGESFDLLFSAQAWHWVDGSIGYAKAREVLRPRGALALFWNRATYENADLRDELDQIYSRHAPELHAGFPGLRPSELDRKQAQRLRESGVFDAPELRVYPWSRTYTSDEYVRLLSTHSDHRMLPASVRGSLLADVRDLIDRHHGQLTLAYATSLFLTRACR